VECPPFLKPVKAARLDAIAVLRKEAASSVQSSLPQTKEAVEQCLWPSLAQYAQTVFDKMAESRLKSGRRSHSSKAYTHWLRSKCLPAVIDDVCQPIAGQYPTTIRLIVETIGKRHSQALDITKRALWEMVALAIGGPFTENLRKCLIAHLEGRSPHWLARAASPPLMDAKTNGRKRANWPAKRGRQGKHLVLSAPDLEKAAIERAAKRGAIVTPILASKRWKPGRLATEAGVGKNSVYEYLDGTRVRITDENRKAIADALGLDPKALPN
jgi:hypothetical protein